MGDLNVQASFPPAASPSKQQHHTVARLPPPCSFTFTRPCLLPQPPQSMCPHLAPKITPWKRTTVPEWHCCAEPGGCDAPKSPGSTRQTQPCLSDLRCTAECLFLGLPILRCPSPLAQSTGPLPSTGCSCWRSAALITRGSQAAEAPPGLYRGLPQMLLLKSPTQR